jgi:hypothetical protein
MTLGAGSRPRRQGRKRLRPTLLALEDRRLLAPIPVTSTADNGAMFTLRWAIGLANQAGNPTSIALELGTSAKTITLQQGQLDLTNTNVPITIYDGSGQGPVTISGNNTSRVFKIENGVTANISGLAITKGMAYGFFSGHGFGGAMYNLGTANLTDCSISGNTALKGGGGIFNYGAVNLRNCSVYNNQAGDHGRHATGRGGGLYNGSTYRGGTLNLENCVIDGNYAYINGGGLYNRRDKNSAVTLTHCTFRNNAAGTYGGGLDTLDTVVLTDCTITSNQAYRGGGLYDAGSEYSSLTDCTFYDNSAGGSITAYGGGLAIYGTVPNHGPVLIACTITGNTGYRSAGMAVNVFAKIQMSDTIVAGNTKNSGAASDIGGFFSEGSVSGSSNLIGTGGSGGLNPATNQLNVPVSQLGLAPLGFYGGLTETIALMAGSAAIGTGSIQGGVDQRGFARPQGAPSDVGAFQTGPLVVNTTNDYAFYSPQGVLSLRQAVNVANVFAGSTTITFDPTTFGTPQTITLIYGELMLSDPSGQEAITTAGLPATASVTINGNTHRQVFVIGRIGGGVSASLSGLTITGGKAGRGGGVFNAAGANLTLTDCTITGNTAYHISNIYPGKGGGLINYGSATIVNCTISGNTAAQNGGGVFNQGTLSLSSSTISNNSSSTGGGGGLWNAKGPANLIDTIVAGNTDVSKSADDIRGPAAVSGYFNLTGTGGSGGLTKANYNVIGIADPLLAALGSYGGPTQTMALLPGSPAIGTGGVIDQRGIPHPASGLDIGAFQDRGFTIKVVAGSSPQSTMLNTAFANPLAVIVSSPYGDPVSGGVVTFAAPSSGASATLSALTATIGPDGKASVTATANGTPGNYVVTASASGATSPANFHLTNTPAAPEKLVINTQPSPTATAGSPFSTQPVVYVEDQFGHLVTTDNTTQVTVTSLPDGSGPLQGDTTVTVQGGIATFTNLGDNTAETIMLYFTSDPALVPATSDSIVVSPTTASKLAVHTQPSPTAMAGSPFPTQPVVYVEDQYGNLETGDNTTQVTAALNSGTGPLQGTTTVTVSGGVATFTNLSDNKAETISLMFTSVPTFTPTTSNDIVVGAATATRLVIHSQPSPTATAGSPFATQPVIYVEDQYGNLETGDNNTRVTASPRIGKGPLLGTTTVTVTGGIATFTNLHDNKVETIALLFTAPALAKVQSNPIVISPAAASKLSVSAPDGVLRNVPFTVKVTALDPYNNVATGFTGTVHFEATGRVAKLPFNYKFSPADSGMHTFPNSVSLLSPGPQTITVVDGDSPAVNGTVQVKVRSAGRPRRTTRAVLKNHVPAGPMASKPVERNSFRFLRSDRGGSAQHRV